MGTRHLTVVCIDNEYKVAQYGQWDGYYEGGGKDILEDLHTIVADDLEDFKAKVRTCTLLSDEEVSARWQEMGADGSGMVSMDIAEKMKKKYPHLSRDMGYKIVGHIHQSAPGLETQSNLEFAADSLFCEYAYVIDLDNNTFECYKGFNQTPLDETERFKFLEETVEQPAHRSDRYYPVKFVAAFDLNNLPTSDDFLKQMCPPEDEDEDELVNTSSTKMKV